MLLLFCPSPLGFREGERGGGGGRWTDDGNWLSGDDEEEGVVFVSRGFFESLAGGGPAACRLFTALRGL